MNVVISTECAKQIKIIRNLKNKGNRDYEKLYMRIALCVKALESVDCIDDVPFELRFHEGNSDKIGHLGRGLEECLAVDLDGTTRFLTFEIKGNAIVLTSLGHYNINLDKNGKTISLFDEPKKQVNYIGDLNSQGFKEISHSSEETKQLLLEAVRNIDLTDAVIHTFDSNVKKNICPLSPYAVKCRITSALGAWEKQYKQEKNISKIRFEDSQSRDNKVKELVKKYAVSSDNHTSLLERSIVNARGLSNAGAIVCGDKDPNMIAELKTMLDESWVKHFSDLIRYVNKKVSSDELKKELFSDMGKALLRSFDKKYDRIVEEDNEDLKSLDKSLRQAVFEDIDNILSLQLKEYKEIRKTNQQFIFGRLFPKFTAVVQNLKSLFSGKGQTNEADNSVESVAFPKEQEENITKTDKNVKEAQESTWAKSGQQKQGDSFDFETSKTINETMDYLRKELREVEERLKDTDCTAEEKQRLEAHKQGLRETYETFESANKKLSSLRTTKSKNKRAEASKEVEVNEETQEEDPAVARRNVMEENEKKNNTLGNVNSSGKKSRRSL